MSETPSLHKSCEEIRTTLRCSRIFGAIGIGLASASSVVAFQHESLVPELAYGALTATCLVVTGYERLTSTKRVLELAGADTARSPAQNLHRTLALAAVPPAITCLIETAYNTSHLPVSAKFGIMGLAGLASGGLCWRNEHPTVTSISNDLVRRVTLPPAEDAQTPQLDPQRAE